MRRAVFGLLMTVLLVGCDDVWTPEQQQTKTALVNAQLVRAAVSYQVNRYGEVLRAAATAADPSAQAGKNLAEYYASPECQVILKLLTSVQKPAPAGAAFKKGKELDEVQAATAELAMLAMQPRGAWDEWNQKIDAAKTRLYRATEALEQGQKSYVLIDTRQEANIKSAEFTASITKAKTGGEAPPAK